MLDEPLRRRAHDLEQGADRPSHSPLLGSAASGATVAPAATTNSNVGSSSITWMPTSRRIVSAFVIATSSATSGTSRTSSRQVASHHPSPLLTLHEPSNTTGNFKAVLTERETTNRLMLRARDAMDRDYAGPSTSRTSPASRCCSLAHFIRVFKASFGETPHRYLQRRRVERAMYLLRDDRPQRHRRVHGRRVRQPRHLQPHLQRRSSASRRRSSARRGPRCRGVPHVLRRRPGRRPSSFGEAS